LSVSCSEKGVRLAQNRQVGSCIHDCGNTVIKGSNWPNFWANFEYFSLVGPVYLVSQITHEIYRVVLQ
jgi:hypothetical protein